MKKLLVLFLLISGVAVIKPNAAHAQTTTVFSGINDESEYYKFASLARTADLGATLAKLGTYTVFAPDNAIFRDMPSTKLDSLTGDKDKLIALLKAHIVKGKFTTADIIKKLSAGNGKTTLTNLLGQPLKLSRTKDNKLLLTDVNGTQIHFLAFDMADPHGVIHGIDQVLNVK